MKWKYVLAWFGMLFLAVTNGAIREFFFKDALGTLQAHRLSTVTLLILFAGYIWVVIRAWRPDSSSQAWAVGIMWVTMTLVFEFGFGRFGSGKSWNDLLEDYNLIEGRLWALIPIWVTIAPSLFLHLQKERSISKISPVQAQQNEGLIV